MAELRPYPFAALVTRLVREWERERKIFDLPESRFWLGSGEHDHGVTFHGARAASPFGPAAGPQSQLAQNLVLSWLAGGRIMELKTVQVDDELVIPRPCIDMQTVGYNVEWSQELRVPASLEEYVKGAMLIEILRHGGLLEIPAGWGDTVFDMSVGYDLAGIRSRKVLDFIQGMKDATPIVDRLRGQIPAAHAGFRDLAFPRELSRTLTLSTFHGCPPDEIEAIIDFLLRRESLHCIVKLNPMLLGAAETRELLHDRLGYTDIVVPDTAFTRDTTWSQAVDFVGRLGATAADLGLGFGVKLTNTLIVENRRSFFAPDVREMYLSGRPLHVLAMHLLRRFRRELGDACPVSFSAGIERANYPDAVALGLVPVTVCSDLLRPGGYGRGRGYADELSRRMADVGASDVDELVLRAFGHADRVRAEAGESDRAGQLSRARLLNTESYVENLADDPRYHASRNAKVPRKIGRRLVLFDCITCDKCIPVCPNDANFRLRIAAGSVPTRRLVRDDGGWRGEAGATLHLDEKHQIASFADFCNECGNCDVFCPEDGGPYLVKPRFFGTIEDFHAQRHLDGFHVESEDRVLARIDGNDFTLAGDVLEGPDFRVRIPDEAVLDAAEAADALDLAPAALIALVRDAVLDPTSLNYVNAAVGGR